MIYKMRKNKIEINLLKFKNQRKKFLKLILNHGNKRRERNKWMKKWLKLKIKLMKQKNILQINKLEFKKLKKQLIKLMQLF